jgi:predicted PurR-regulated permease PerM
VAEDGTARRFFLILLLVTTVLLAMVIRPLATALFLAAVLSGVLQPLQKRLTRLLRGREHLASGLLVAGVAVLLMGPLVGLAAFLLDEGQQALRFVLDAVRGQDAGALLERLPDSVEKVVRAGLARLGDLDADMQKQLTGQGGKAVAAIWAAISATGSAIFGATMMLIALYFLLAEGDGLVKWLEGTLPLRPGQTRELLAEFKKVSYSVIVSSVITSAVQAAAALIGFFIGRVPHPLFFAAVTFFGAFIPAIGAAGVCLLAAGILFVTGHSYAALFLALWGVTVVGLVDNLVKPLLIKVGMEMHSAVVFFALLGGLGAFGSIGLLLGPLVVALFLTLLKIYRRDYRPHAAGKPHSTTV